MAPFSALADSAAFPAQSAGCAYRTARLTPNSGGRGGGTRLVRVGFAFREL
jgi:hypothetical protein